MSVGVFTKVRVPGLELEHPLHYADSAVSVVKLRVPLVSEELKIQLHQHLLDVKLNPQLADFHGVYEFAAKVYDICHPSPNQIRRWLHGTTILMFIFAFDDHFDMTLRLSPENIARLCKEVRAVLRCLSSHNLSGLQGNLEDWPAEVPAKEAYLWLLREAEDLREGAAQLMHDTFVDYLFGLEVEMMEWQPDLYRNDLTAWSLDRYIEVRKHSSGSSFVFVGPLFIAHKWLQKEHIFACADLQYENATVAALANDIQGMNKDRKVSDISSLKIVSSSEVVQYHNKKVKELHKKILELEGNTKRFMEELEACVVGAFMWGCVTKRYTGG